MRKILFILFAFAMTTAPAFAASITGTAVTLCGRDKYLRNGTCISYAQGDCDSGYVKDGQVSSSTTFLRPYVHGCRENGYSYMNISDAYVPHYNNGYTMGTAVTTCPSDERLNGGTCTPYTTGNCATGRFDDTKILKNTFIPPVDGICREYGYSYMNLSDELDFIYNGLIIGTAVAVCPRGQYNVNGTCTAYVRDDCPENWIDITTTDTTFVPMSSGVCGSGYTKQSFPQQCNKLQNNNNMCGVVCTGDLFYSDIGVCDNLCPYEAQYLNARTDDGTVYTWPVYETQQIVPSFVVEFDSGNKCYVNLLSGAGQNALNVQHNGTTYHTVK